MGCKEFFPTALANYKAFIDEIGSITPDKDTYLLLDTSLLDAYSLYLEGDETKDGNIENDGVKYVYDDDSFKENIITEQDVIDVFEKEIFPGYKLQFNSSEYVFGRMIHTFNIVPEDDYFDISIDDYIMTYKAKVKGFKESRKSESISEVSTQ